MTSKQEQPHFEAEMFTMLTVINFMISFDGLKEQLLNLVVKRENDKLYRQNRELNAAMIVSK
jgi:dynein heavy chain